MILPQQFLGVQRFHPNNPNNQTIQTIRGLLFNMAKLIQSRCTATATVIYQPPKKRWISRRSCGKSFYQHVRPDGTNSLGMSRFFRMQILWRQWNSGIFFDTLSYFIADIPIWKGTRHVQKRKCWFIKPSFTDDFTCVCFWWCLPPHCLFVVCWFFSHLIPFILSFI